MLNHEISDEIERLKMLIDQNFVHYSNNENWEENIFIKYFFSISFALAFFIFFIVISLRSPKLKEKKFV